MKKLFKNLLLFVSLIASSNLIQAQISGSTSVCQSSPGMYFCDQTSSTYAWSVSPNSGVGVSDTTLQYVDIIFPSAGNYTLTVYTSGPIDTFSVAVSVYTTLPSPIASDVTYCQGDSVFPLTATPSSGGVIDWYADAGATILIPTPTPSNSSTYYVMETLNGCQSSLIPVYATFNNLPTILATNNSPICANSTLYFNAAGATIYTWSGPNGFSSTLQNPQLSPATIVSSGTYTLTGTDFMGCSSDTTTTVIINASHDISGTVTSNASTITSGQVYLFAPSQTLYMYDTIAVTSLNASGQYLFSSITSGNYLVKCVPDTSVYPNSIDTYYGNASQWDSAMVINHDCTFDFTADIELVIASLLTGPGTISGRLIEEDGFGSYRTINPSNEIMAPGGPIKGITINLLSTPSGQLQAQTISDSTGYFEFTSVAIGDYTLFVDIPGLIMDSSYIIQITPIAFVSGVNSISSMSYTDLNFAADSNSIFPTNPSVGINELKDKTPSSQDLIVYPNPAKNNVIIKTTGFDTKGYVVELVNAQGQSVFTNKQNSASDYTLDLKKLNITSGLYIVKLSSGSVIKTTKLIIE